MEKPNLINATEEAGSQTVAVAPLTHLCVI